MKYLSKPREVSARRFLGTIESALEIQDWLSDLDVESVSATWNEAESADRRIVLDLGTPAASYEVEEGDWITHDEGDVRRYTNDTFWEHFEESSDGD